LVIWPYPGGEQREVIELKLRRDSLEQTWTYMDRCEAEAGHLVIFDRDKTRSWEEKIFSRQEIHKGQKIKMWGM
jgi:hypothetical protein